MRQAACNDGGSGSASGGGGNASVSTATTADMMLDHHSHSRQQQEHQQQREQLILAAARQEHQQEQQQHQQQQQQREQLILAARLQEYERIRREEFLTSQLHRREAARATQGVPPRISLSGTGGLPAAGSLAGLVGGGDGEGHPSHHHRPLNPDNSANGADHPMNGTASSTKASPSLSSSSAPPSGGLSSAILDMYAKSAAEAITKIKKKDTTDDDVTTTAKEDDTGKDLTASPFAALPSTLAAAETTATTKNSDASENDGSSKDDDDRSTSSTKNRSASAGYSGGMDISAGGGTAATAITSNHSGRSTTSTLNALELEAAKALLGIPGNVTQASGKPIRGRWELVPPQQFQPQTNLSQQLPSSVLSTSTSDNLSLEQYKKLGQRMCPPRVMRIPDNWDASQEQMYLVVEPETAKAAAARTSSTQPPAGVSSPSEAGSVSSAGQRKD